MVFRVRERFKARNHQVAGKARKKEKKKKRKEKKKKRKKKRVREKNCYVL